MAQEVGVDAGDDERLERSLRYFSFFNDNVTDSFNVSTVEKSGDFCCGVLFLAIAGYVPGLDTIEGADVRKVLKSPIQ